MIFIKYIKSEFLNISFCVLLNLCDISIILKFCLFETTINILLESLVKIKSIPTFEVSFFVTSESSQFRVN